MQFSAAIQQANTHAKLLVQRLRIVANNFQASALGRPLRPESAHDGTASGLHRVDGGLRNIEDGDVFTSASEKIIDQCGLATANVDHRSTAIRRHPLNQGERSFKVQTVPTDCVQGFLGVDLFPMGLRVHANPCLAVD